MFSGLAPTSAEWLTAYGPVAFGLLAACVTELRSNRIPNAIALVVLGWGVLARLVWGPLGYGTYGLSLVVAIVTLIGIAWIAGWAGGGAVKLGVATAAILPAPLGVVFCLLFLGLLFLFLLIRGSADRRTVPGSLVLSAVYAVTLGLAAWKGTPAGLL